jgi:hypothetical protein
MPPDYKAKQHHRKPALQALSTSSLHRYGALRGISVLDLRTRLVGSAISSVTDRLLTGDEGIRMQSDPFILGALLW